MPVIVTSAGPSRWHAVPAAVFAAIAVWLSSGAIAFKSTSGARIGVLPLGARPLAAAIVVAVIVFAAGRRSPRGAAVVVAPLALLAIPWLPMTLPPAFLIWTGAFTMPIWIGVALALVSVPLGDGAWHGHSLAPPRVHVSLAFAAGCVVFGAAAWSASAAIPGGDEPHYLVITQSLLHDRDLDVENNYARGDYREYYGGPLSPDFRVRGRHGELFSIHAPGIPALVLPAFAVGGYQAVVAFLVLVSAAACALAWWMAWRATSSHSAAWFGWAVVVCAAPFLLESFTVYPDAPGAAIVLTAFWALWRIDAGETPGNGAWLLHGAALAALPWMHTRFALLAVVLGLLVVFRLLRTANASRVPAFLAVPMLSAAGWMAAAYAMYGTPNPAAAYGGQSDTALAFLPNGLGGLLFDQGFGVIATAPALAIALAGLPRARRFAVEWSVTAIFYASAVGSYAMWWAGTSGPARFLVPLLLPLSVPAAAAWQSARSRGARVVMILALAVTAWMAAVLAAGAGGFLAYHSRNVYGMTPAPWLRWANALVDLSQALPAFVPLPAGTPLGARMAAARAGFAATAPWVLCLAAAAYVTMWCGRKRGVRLSEVVAASAAAFAVATMVAASAVWWMHGAHRVEALDAQLDVLRHLSGRRAVALDLLNARRVSGVEALKMRMDVRTEDESGAPAAMAAIPLLPAGSYLISTRGTLRAPAAIFAGADEEPFPIMTASPADMARGVTLDLPVTVRAVTVRASSFAGVSAIEVRPIAPRFSGPRSPTSDLRGAAVAHHAAAYGQTRVYFLDDRTAPEEDGFWIWGAREGDVVFDAGEVVLRNGPVQNEVTIRTGDREQHVTLQPGEARPVAIPSAYIPHPQLTHIRTSAGFRPSDVDSRSADRRFLGVYVVMPDHAVR
jgi:hypothetical protein